MKKLSFLMVFVLTMGVFAGVPVFANGDVTSFAVGASELTFVGSTYEETETATGTLANQLITDNGDCDGAPDDQMWAFRNPNLTYGDYIEFDYNVPENVKTGNYKLTVRYKRNTARGTYRTDINGRSAGYIESGKSSGGDYPATDYGTTSLRGGETIRIRFTLYDYLKKIGGLDLRYLQFDFVDDTPGDYLTMMDLTYVDSVGQAVGSNNQLLTGRAESEGGDRTLYLFTPSSFSTNNFVSFSFIPPAAGAYDLYVRLQNGANNGKYRVVIDDNDIGEVSGILTGSGFGECYAGEVSITGDGNPKNIAFWSMESKYKLAIAYLRFVPKGGSEDPVETSISDINISSSTASFTVTKGDEIPSTAKVIAAGYKAKGELVNAKIMDLPVADEPLEFELLANVTEVKVFLLDWDMGLLKPLCGSKAAKK